jgi:hypothetical protein
MILTARFAASSSGAWRTRKSATLLRKHEILISLGNLLTGLQGRGFLQFCVYLVVVVICNIPSEEIAIN